MSVNLNLACGHRHIEGYDGIDMVDHGAQQKWQGDIKKLDFDDDSVGKMICIHAIEHFSIWEVKPMLEEWLRCLQPGGELILEFPDAYKCMLHVLSGNPNPYLGIYGIYGDPSEQRKEQHHLWAWHGASMVKMLQECGYVDVEERKAEYKFPLLRDVRVVGYKPKVAG